MLRKSKGLVRAPKVAKYYTFRNLSGTAGLSTRLKKKFLRRVFCLIQIRKKQLQKEATETKGAKQWITV